MNAAKEARAAGKSWRQAFQAAKSVGYSGSEQGIKKMVFYDSPAPIKASARHRKNRLKAPRRPGPSRDGLNAIQQMVDRMVRERVQKIIGRAITTLQQAQKEI
jgi:hypothetical protein